MDVSDACTASCSTREVEFAPTAVPGTSGVRPRPWVDTVTDGRWHSNVTTSAEDALACLAQVGVTGCDYESPVEAVESLVRRARDPEAAEFGFFRDEAFLLVIVITDEDDCSMRDTSILDPGSPFRPPGAETSRAPSAVCFRAGMTCDPGESGFWDCVPVDRTPEGDVGSPEEAVLTPPAALLDALASGIRDVFERAIHVAPIRFVANRRCGIGRQDKCG